MMRERVLNVLILLGILVMLGLTFAAGSEAFSWFSHGVVVTVALYLLVHKK